MKIHNLTFSLLLLISPLLSPAQTAAVGNLTAGLQQDKNTFTLTTDKASIQLEFCSPEMVRIRTSWSGTFEANEPYMVSRYQWEPVAVQVSEEADGFLLTTDKLTLRLQKTPFALEIANRQGDVLSTELLPSGSGGAYTQNERVGSRKKLQPDEHFFGFGERMDFVDQRGKQLRLNVGRGEAMPHIVGAYNILEANYAPVPFFMSTRGYGIFLHNPYATRWDMGHSQPGSYTFEAEGGELDYYFIYGPDFPAMLHQYTELTGKSPLLPRFAHGLHVGTYSGGTWGHESLTSTNYVVELARRFREAGIPVDVFHLDSTWRMFGENGGKGATTFEWRETFRNPKAMFDSLYAMNINMAGLHVRPRFDNGKQLRLLDQARASGFVYPEENNPGEFVNFFDEASVDWWWENGVMKIAEQGAMFLKTDEGSAFGRKANESDKVGPTSAEAQRLHNIFPIAYAKAPFERFSKLNGMRGMNHTREGYAGIQRYPFIWAGDWPSEWQYFAPVIRAGLNIGLSGVGYWSHNMGGFEHDADPELYIRWVQFGMFSPIAHVFGMDHPGYKEPWNYGKEALENFTKYDRLRYRLIPYIYSQAYVQHTTGLPLMRALVLQHQQDENTYTLDDQYLFGSSLLIAPVTTKGAQTRVVYLPEGQWIDYWTGKTYQGKKHYNVLTPLDQLPIFVKAGAILPMQEEIQYDNRQPWGDLTLEIYPGDSATFELYEDDGLSEAYKDGSWSITPMRSQFSASGRAVRLEKARGSYAAPARNYLLKIHQEAAPTAVNLSLNGRKIKKFRPLEGVRLQDAKAQGWLYDAEAKVLWVKHRKAADEALEISISN